MMQKDQGRTVSDTTFLFPSRRHHLLLLLLLSVAIRKSKSEIENIVVLRIIL